MNTKIIYLDNNATTLPHRSIVDAHSNKMCCNGYFNINTNSYLSKKIKDDIEKMSLEILRYSGLSSETYDVLYANTSTEINRAIIEYFGAENVVTTPYEHKSIREITNGVASILSLDKKNGIVKPQILRDVLGSREGRPTLVSIMAANNEFPARNDIKELVKTSREFENVVFHTDATQLFGKKVIEGEPDLLNFSLHKFHGLKGVAVLIYNKKSIDPTRLRLAGGTPNSPAILAHADMWRELPKDTDEKYLNLRIHLFERLCKLGMVSLEPDDISYLNPGTCLISFPGICNLKLKKNLDDNNVIVSIGSACDTSKAGASDTVKALGLLGNDGIIRVSFGAYTTIGELDNFVKIMKKILPLSCK